MDLMTRLQPLLPSLLLEPEVEYVRGGQVRSLPIFSLIRPACPTDRGVSISRVLGYHRRFARSCFSSTSVHLL